MHAVQPGGSFYDIGMNLGVSIVRRCRMHQSSFQPSLVMDILSTRESKGGFSESNKPSCKQIETLRIRCKPTHEYTPAKIHAFKYSDRRRRRADSAVSGLNDAEPVSSKASANDDDTLVIPDLEVGTRACACPWMHGNMHAYADVYEHTRCFADVMAVIMDTRVCSRKPTFFLVLMQVCVRICLYIYIYIYIYIYLHTYIHNILVAAIWPARTLDEMLVSCIS
jgi:hypothetical protein